MKKAGSYIGAILFLALPFHTASAAPQSPEKIANIIAQGLRPISNDEWARLAGPQSSADYEITRGDTLFDISKRLFGDGKYWPKIWALNNPAILNPHLIHPGNRIVFAPGSGTSLPSVQVATQETAVTETHLTSTASGVSRETQEARDHVEVADNTETADAETGVETVTDAGEPIPTYTKKARSMEWKYLPRQDWEAEKIKQIMASRLEIKVTGTLSTEARSSFLTDLKYFVESSKLSNLGQIDSSPVDNANFRIGDTVILTGSNLVAGTTYDVVSDPAILERLDSDRIGYAYSVLAQVQVIHPQGDQWIGKITQVFHFAERGAHLAPMLPKVAEMTPVAAPKPLEGEIYLDLEFHSYIGQYQHGFVNLGTDDGIHEGMIFETFQDKDNEIETDFSDPTYFHISNLQVIQVSNSFCMVRVLSGSKELSEGLPVRALTDISRFNNGKFNNITLPEVIPAPSPEPLPPVSPEALPEPTVEPTAEPSPSPSPIFEAPPLPLPPPVPVVQKAVAPKPAPAPSAEPAPAELPLPPMEAPPESPNTTEPSPLPFDPTSESLPTPPLEMPPTPTAPAAGIVPAPVPPPATIPSVPQTRVKVKNELDDLDQPDEPLDLQAQKELKQLENYKETAQNGGSSTSRDTPLEMPPPPSDPGPSNNQMTPPPAQNLPPVQIQPSS